MNKIVTDNRGEGHIGTAVKIIIAVVIGLLVLGGIYLVYADVILPNMETKVEAMMNTSGTVQLRKEGAQLQKSIDGENWVTISPAMKTADTEVVTVKSITKNNETVWVVLTKDSAMYTACYTKDGSNWGPILSSRQQIRLSANTRGTYLYLTFPGGREYASSNGIDWYMTSTDNY